MTATFQKKNNEPLTSGIAAVWEFDAVPGDAAD